MKSGDPKPKILQSKSSESISTDQEIAKTLEYIRHELPLSEPRIPKKMHKECKVSVAIPAYQEGKEILTSLAYLAKQKDVFKDEYEVIVNVNNRPNPDPRTRELNDLTLRVLYCIQDPSLSTEFLSEEEKKVVEEIRKSGVVVYVIDKSTNGHETKLLSEHDFKETGPMQPRKRTMDEICERFALARKTDGIIASLDADTKVNPKWVKQMIDSFADGNIKMLAGERRDGLDIDEKGTVIDQIDVMNKMLDYWNSKDRQEDEILSKFPRIENQTERARILLMSYLIDAFNAARERDDKTAQTTGEILENFRGGSGKAFKVSAYIGHPREIIEMMDTSIDELPEDLRKNECRYVGRSKKNEQTDITTQDLAIEALAIYPETRLRSWQLTSPDSESPYDDFTNLDNPYGSSGKELIYAVVAVLTGRIPRMNTRNPLKHPVDIIEALQLYSHKYSNGQVANPDKYFFNVLSRMVSQSQDVGLEKKIVQIFGTQTKVFEMPEKVSYAEAAEKYKRLFSLF